MLENGFRLCTKIAFQHCLLCRLLDFTSNSNQRLLITNHSRHLIIDCDNICLYRVKQSQHFASSFSRFINSNHRANVPHICLLITSRKPDRRMSDTSPSSRASVCHQYHQIVEARKCFFFIFIFGNNLFFYLPSQLPKRQRV